MVAADGVNGDARSAGRGRRRTVGGGSGQETGESYPVASLISVPFQLNYDEGYGPEGDGSRSVLNIQPVIPFSLDEDWNYLLSYNFSQCETYPLSR